MKLTAEIPYDLALRLLLGALAGNEPADSYLELRPLEPTGRQVFTPVRELRATVETIVALRDRHEFIGVGVTPRVTRSGCADAVARSWCLVADLDSPEAVTALHSFSPAPSVIVRSRTPGHLHAYWSLRQPVSPAWHVRACLRIATRLGSDRAVCDPPRVMRAPISFEHIECRAFTVAEVVGGLPDPREYAPSPRPERPACSPVAVLDGLVRVVREAEQGTRNTRLNWSAYRAGEHVAAGELDPDDARAALLDAAIGAGLPEGEAAATINSGLHAGSAT